MGEMPGHEGESPPPGGSVSLHGRGMQAGSMDPRGSPGPVTTRKQVQELQRELDQARSELVRLRAQAEMLREVLASRSWRWTRPFRFLSRLLRHGRLLDSDRDRMAGFLRRVWRRLVGGLGRGSLAPLPPPRSEARGIEDLVPAPQLLRLDLRPAQPTGLPDVYIWAVIDWHFRMQRPQHIARALADAGHRVFYISNNFIDHADAGFALEPLDTAGRLFQVHLHLRGAPAIYDSAPGPDQLAQLAPGLNDLAHWHEGPQAVSIVQHPYWTVLAGRPPVTRMVYDCMDHHAGFSNNTSTILDEERSLAATADLIVTTSQWLQAEMKRSGRPVALIRNATEFEHFHEPCARRFVDAKGRRVIGYYGAIAEWFDLDLVREVAQAYPQAIVVLVGNDTVRAQEALAGVANVRFVGEVKYSELPYWLHGFDVCLLPFRVEPLTLATNPVKIYEYLSAGKPVVAVDLPEMAQFGELVQVASTRKEYLAAVGACLDERADSPLRTARMEFAARQTWSHRAAELDAVLDRLCLPKVSVIVVTYNNIEYTRRCLESLELFSDWQNLEVIVVDNASRDGTQDMLERWAAAGNARQVILNSDNKGFAAANNQGLAAASGEYLILLNNDTYVTRGWVRGLVTHLRRNPGVGLVGPVTNNIGNEARVETSYFGMMEMAAFARQYTALHAGRAFALPTLAFFCVAMSRDTYELVGPLDEDFGMGFFEDDDYCRRVALAGLACVCAEDVFVHHQLSASFDSIDQDRRRALFERNRAIYEKKWGGWKPHSYR
jgi:GT2 family glycosyltransferase/glycosyltransferase involved in cell wall biosynthesis